MTKFLIAGCYTFLTTFLCLEGIHGHPIPWITPVLLSGAIAFIYWYDFITEEKDAEDPPDEK